MFEFYPTVAAAERYNLTEQKYSSERPSHLLIEILGDRAADFQLKGMPQTQHITPVLMLENPEAALAFQKKFDAEGDIDAWYAIDKLARLPAGIIVQAP